MKTAIIGILFCILLTGCGSGGGDGGGGAIVPKARPIATNTLRTFANGDNIQYTLTGRISSGGVTTPLTGTAAYSITTSSSPLDPTGTTRSVNTIAMTGTFSDGTPFTFNANTYFSQTASGSFNIYGDSMSMWITAPPSGFVTGLKSPIVLPDSWINSYTQQNGDITSETITVLGKATVTTGMGTFETFKYQSDSTEIFASGDTDVSTEISYVVPSIGPVKITVSSQSTDIFGVVTTGQLTLVASATNIPF